MLLYIHTCIISVQITLVKIQGIINPLEDGLTVPDSQVAEKPWKEIHDHGVLKFMRVARVHGTERSTGKVERPLRVTAMEV